jgi:hypothetical protein
VRGALRFNRLSRRSSRANASGAPPEAHVANVQFLVEREDFFEKIRRHNLLRRAFFFRGPRPRPGPLAMNPSSCSSIEPRRRFSRARR